MESSESKILWKLRYLWQFNDCYLLERWIRLCLILTRLKDLGRPYKLQHNTIMMNGWQDNCACQWSPKHIITFFGQVCVHMHWIWLRWHIALVSHMYNWDANKQEQCKKKTYFRRHINRHFSWVYVTTRFKARLRTGVTVCRVSRTTLAMNK